MPGQKSILYVEDNYENRTLVRRLLQSFGYLVLEADSADEALNVLSTNHPDLILMDINMPDVDGYSLTQQIKAMPEFHSTPVIAITANVMRGDREKTLQAGCDSYIEKPIDVDHFLDMISSYL